MDTTQGKKTLSNPDEIRERLANDRALAELKEDTAKAEALQKAVECKKKKSYSLGAEPPLSGLAGYVMTSFLMPPGKIMGISPSTTSVFKSLCASPGTSISGREFKVPNHKAKITASYLGENDVLPSASTMEYTTATTAGDYFVMSSPSTTVTLPPTPPGVVVDYIVADSPTSSPETEAAFAKYYPKVAEALDSPYEGFWAGQKDKTPPEETAKSRIEKKLLKIEGKI